MNTEKVKLLVHTVQELSLARNIDTITGIVRRAARKLTAADGASFVLRENDMCYYADEDAIEPLWKGQHFPMSICISGWTMMHKQGAVVEDIYADKRVPIAIYRPTFVKSMAMVPIRTMDPIGAIGAYWAHQHAPTDEEMVLLQSLADITSVSIENVYAYHELKEQNQKLYNIAHLQSHQVRVPITQIQGIYNLFNFEEFHDPQNADLLHLLKSTADSLDTLVRDISQMTNSLKVPRL